MGLERIIFASDLHGDLLDSQAVDALYAFTKEWKPHHKIFGGDLFDFRPLRKGATTEEKAETIRRRLFSEEGVNMTPAKQMEMMHEGRLDHIETVIKPALEAGKTVISDRFEMSSVVYQAWFDKEHLIPIYKKSSEFF